MPSILVTGASAGIGRAVAEHFADQGWTVGLVARRAGALAEMARPGMIPLPADVTDEAAVEAVFDQFCAATGRLDVLFNNAGVASPAVTIDQISLDEWRRVLDVNLTGMFLCARAAFARMRAQDPQGGRIINNGSISAVTPRAGSTCYTTTKHGVLGLTKTMNLDGRDLNIAVGQIDIGNAGTDMLTQMNAERVENGLDPDPVMDVADVAKAVMTMASLPPEANVLNMTVMANKMPFVGRG